MAEFKAEMARELRATWLRGYRDGLSAVSDLLTKGLTPAENMLVIQKMLSSLPKD